MNDDDVLRLSERLSEEHFVAYGHRRNQASRLAARLDQPTSAILFKRLSEFAAKPMRKNWFLKGIIAGGETTAWVGPPGSLKSALMASLAVSVASGRDWYGHRSKVTCGVCYLAFERKDLVERRLLASCGGADRSLPIAVSSEVIDLMKPQTAERLVAAIRLEGQRMGREIGLVIVDTFAKAIAAGGGDENQARDQGIFFANIARIKEQTGVHIAIVGHTGKDETRGMRGSNASYGDVDVMIEISGDAIKTANVTKANDRPEGKLFLFKSDIVDFGADEDGDPITVNVAVEASDDGQNDEAAGRKQHSQGVRMVREAVSEAIVAFGLSHVVGGDGPSVKAVQIQAAREFHKRRYVSDGEGNRADAERKAWQRNFDKARRFGAIGAETTNQSELVWLI
jgi:hypothetical protein